LEYVLRALPGVMIHDLGLADDVSMSQQKDYVTVNLVRPFFDGLCGTDMGDNRVGCPVCSSIGEVLAYVSERPVVRAEERSSGRSSTITYWLGPRTEASE